MSSFSPDPCVFRRRRKDARPAELLEAALALFVEKGFAATRSEEVARAAGVSKGTLYLYFPSKEELLKAVIQHFLADEVTAGVAEAATLDGPTPRMMADLLVPWWSRIYGGPASGVMKVVITEVRNFPEIAQFFADRVVIPGEALVSQLLQRGVDRGEFQVDDIPAAVHSILMPMTMLCLHKHTLGVCATGVNDVKDDPVAFMHAHLALIFKGLEVRPAESSQRIDRKPRRAA
jgi:AcrR family transcriptional regulator